MILKITGSLLLLVSAFLLSSNAHGSNFSHIKTGGFDYAYDIINNSDTEARWLATHHDVVVGLGDWQRCKLPERIYDVMKAANPDIVFYQYIAFNTMLAAMTDWMSDWCRANGKDPEKLFYHYYSDTSVKLRNGQTVAYKGYGGGTAANLSGARVPATWWQGAYPNINPSSQTFRDAFEAFATDTITINASAGKYADGLLLDTFEGTVDEYFNIHLENTIEMRALGLTIADAAITRATADLIAARNELEANLSSVTKKPMRVFPNGADVDNIYQWYPNVYKNALSGTYDEISVEFLITSTSNLNRIPRLASLYEDLEAGNRFFINSQTNVYDIPFGFIQFVVATHYLINHPNGIFSIHRGSAANYNGQNGTLRDTHWHKIIEFNIGSPVVRTTGTDYWGEHNTNRFFIFTDGGASYKVLAREYQKALVLAKFSSAGGVANIGNNPTTHQLNGNYRRLQEDGSLGPIITSISLGTSEGAILIKVDQGGGNINSPLNLRIASEGK